MKTIFDSATYDSMKIGMNPLLIILLALLLLTACSGSKAVQEEIDGYLPPAVYQAAQAAPPAAESSTTVGDTFNADFSKQREKLLQMKQAAQKALEQPITQESFYTPEAGRLEALAPAINDPAEAQKLLSNDFSLTDLEILTWSRNPMLKSAANNFRAALEAYDQVANLDDVLAQYIAFTAGSMAGVGPTGNMGGIDKLFPFPGITALKGDIAKAETMIAREDLEIVRRTIITEARRLYWELYYNRKARATTSESITLLDGFEASVQQRYAGGQIPLRELVMLRIRKEKLKEKLITLTENGRSLDSRFKALLLLPDEAVMGSPQGHEIHPALPDLAKLNELALTHAQELIRMGSMINRMELMIEMGETEIYPGFSQNYSLTENRAVTTAGTGRMDTAFQTNVPAGAGAGQPKMPFMGLSEAYLRETRRRLNGLRQELAGLTAETAAKVREGWVAADQARREDLLYREKLSELARVNVRTAGRAYESGEISFGDALEALMLELTTKLAAERRKADQGITTAVLKATVGFSWPEKQEG